MIEISVNGELKQIKEGLNIEELVVELGYPKEGFAIAVNLTFVALREYKNTTIKAGDTIDILAPVQGG